MDALEENAKKHCSHLSRSQREWIIDMVAIIKKAPLIPIYQKDRIKLYKMAGIPDGVIRACDKNALMEALSDIHKGITGGKNEEL